MSKLFQARIPADLHREVRILVAEEDSNQAAFATKAFSVYIHLLSKQPELIGEILGELGLDGSSEGWDDTPEDQANTPSNIVSAIAG